MSYSIDFDETEFQDGLTAWALDWITHLYGAEMAELLDPEVVPVDVGNNSVCVLRPAILPVQNCG